MLVLGMVFAVVAACIAQAVSVNNKLCMGR